MTIMQKRIKVVIADDHQVFRDGLKSAIERSSERFEVVGEAATGYRAYLLCIEENPDVLILDLHMPGDLNGFQVLKALRRKSLPLKIMILTADPHGADVIVADLGADICLDKSLPRDEILSKLEILIAKPARRASIHTHNSKNVNPVEVPGQMLDLSPKELAVLKAAAKGKDTTTIAQELIITRGTVNVHLHAIYKKLGVKSLPQALSFAYRNNVITEAK